MQTGDLAALTGKPSLRALGPQGACLWLICWSVSRLGWLTVYLASLHLEDIRGDNNLKRIQSQVMDAFNEKLFPDSKPKIKNVLFKEFAVQ